MFTNIIPGLFAFLYHGRNIGIRLGSNSDPLRSKADGRPIRRASKGTFIVATKTFF